MSTSIQLRRLAAFPVALVAASALVVTSGLQTEASAGINATKRAKKVSKAVKIAKKQVGDPYVYGAAGPNSFDCSGFTSYAYGKAGVKLGRTTGAQASQARRIPRKKLRKGDLVFFHSGGSVYHVGLFWKRKAGSTVILHAPRTGQNVSFSRTWTNSWFAGTLRGKGKVKRTPRAPKLKPMSHTPPLMATSG